MPEIIQPIATTVGVYQHFATVKRIVDGDTLEVTIDLGYHISLDVIVRLDGLNAPERDTIAGESARLWLSAVLPIGEKILITSRRLDKYRRSLGNIVKRASGENINLSMIAAGHAQPAKE